MSSGFCKLLFDNFFIDLAFFQEKRILNIMNTNKIEQYNALDIARWLVNQGITDERYMTNLALNKLAYFAHGFSYRINDVPLIDIRICPAFEAWKYG